jgi:hypothetical protein
MFHALPNAYMGLKVSFGNNDPHLRHGHEVRDRLLRRVVLSSHAMVVGVELDEFLDAMKAWKSTKTMQKTRSQSVLDEVNRWKTAKSSHDLTDHCEHGGPSHKIERCFRWFDAAWESDVSVELLDIAKNPDKLLHALHDKRGYS